jgi:hypothetical protein
MGAAGGEKKGGLISTERERERERERDSVVSCCCYLCVWVFCFFLVSELVCWELLLMCS